MTDDQTTSDGGKSSDEPTVDMTSGTYTLGQEEPQADEESQPMRPRFVFPVNATELWEIAPMLTQTINDLWDETAALRDELAEVRAQLVTQYEKYDLRVTQLRRLVLELAERVKGSLDSEAYQRSQLALRLTSAENPIGVPALQKLQMERLLSVFDRAGMLSSSFDPDLLAQMLSASHRHLTDDKDTREN
jgi:hypothetical protein